MLFKWTLIEHAPMLLMWLSRQNQHFYASRPREFAEFHVTSYENASSVVKLFDWRPWIQHNLRQQSLDDFEVTLEGLYFDIRWICGLFPSHLSHSTPSELRVSRTRAAESLPRKKVTFALSTLDFTRASTRYTRNWIHRPTKLFCLSVCSESTFRTRNSILKDNCTSNVTGIESDPPSPFLSVYSEQQQTTINEERISALLAICYQQRGRPPFWRHQVREIPPRA